MYLLGHESEPFFLIVLFLVIFLLEFGCGSVDPSFLLFLLYCIGITEISILYRKNIAMILNLSSHYNLF